MDYKAGPDTMGHWVRALPTKPWLLEHCVPRPLPVCGIMVKAGDAASQGWWKEAECSMEMGLARGRGGELCHPRPMPAQELPQAFLGP